MEEVNDLKAWTTKRILLITMWLSLKWWPLEFQVSRKSSCKQPRRDLSCNHNDGDLFTCEDNMLFSRVKIWSFRAKVHLVFHWCLYNKQKQLIYAFTTIGKAGMVQWRERPPLPMWPGFNSGPVPYLGCVCCSLVLALLRGFFFFGQTQDSKFQFHAWG